MNTIESGNLILVPCDFTPLSYHAIEHGAYMAKAMKRRLVILHIATNENNIQTAEKKLSFVAEECFDKFGIRPECAVRTGSRPYVAIKNTASELNADVVVLKTGGVRGIKRYTGIRTIKILSGTLTPFLVIQDRPENATLRNIVFPINFLKQHDKKLQRVVSFGQYYPDALVHIITPSGKGADKEKQISGNLKVMKKVLEDQGIKVNFITHDKQKNQAENILELSKEINADIIMIQMEDVSTISKFLFGLREEKLITNAHKIPVMCLNEQSEFKNRE